MRVSTVVGAFLLFCVLGGAAIAGTDWPGFRGPNHDGAIPDAQVLASESGTLSLGWKRALGSGYSAIAAGDGKIVTMFAEGDADFLAAFDAESGDEVWRYRIADTYNGHDGSHDGPISTPVMHGGRIFGLGAWGHLFAVDASSGKPVWTSHLADDHGAKKPHYGFATSPLIADGVLVVQLGSEEEGRSIGGFNPEDGTPLWTAGHDTIEYHSPIVASIGGRDQVLSAGKDRIYGLEAKTGEILWSYEHAGDERAMGGMTIVPVPAGDGRVFVMNKVDSSVMLQVKKKGKSRYNVEELWSGNALKQTYVTPVYHEGYLYGMSNRIFTCADAASGEIQWRSREPGDGFPTLVGNHLVIMTKPGSLHVAKASPEGYEELASLRLFDEHSWSEVAYLDGNLYARSMAQLARVNPTAVVATETGAGDARATGFRGFLADLEQATDKDAAIDAYLGRHGSFPIIEGDGSVHFVYRGEAGDVGIVGDMIGFRREDPMTRVDSTDLFYYSTHLEPDAAVTYGFIADFGEPVPDPMNDRAGSGLFGDVSWFSMPAWQAPKHLEAVDSAREGRMETLEWKSEVREEFQDRTAEVYLPADYNEQRGNRYPVVYVHHGKQALEEGSMKNALDNLIGEVIDPLIAVFIVADDENPRGDMRDETYLKMIADELVPMVDAKFRTIPEAMARASVGSGRAANVAMMNAFKHSDLFGRVGSQAPTLGVDSIPELSSGSEEKPLVIYMEWGTYHLRSPHEAWDLAVESARLWTAMRNAGYRPAGGEVPEGYSWACWRGHTDEMLAALFPRKH